MVYKGFEKVKIIRICRRIMLTLICLFIKFFVAIAIIVGIKPRKKTCVENLIVSFTSYGIRLKNCTWLAVYSMFMQSVQPEFVVLYLEKGVKSQKLPFLLRKLQKMGLVIEYCNDIRSYKKLVPALHQYPNKTIITIDDDIYYSKNLIKNLVETSLKNKSAICATVVIGLTFDTDGNVKSYNEWNKNPEQKDILFAVGYGGILYPPSVFNLDYMKEDDFLTIAPTADDIWFFASRFKDNILLVPANKYKITYYPVNYVYERLHKNAGLTEENVFGGKNDIQMRAVLEHFNINLKKDS